MKSLLKDIEEPKLKTIAFNNFKGFGERLQKFEVKPIILVYAPNSVGKSSLLHSLMFLKYFINNYLYQNSFDLKTTKEFGDEIDLGGFENFIHKHDLTKSINYELFVENANKILLMIKGLNELDIKVNNFLVSLIQEYKNYKDDLQMLYEVILDEYNNYTLKQYSDFDEVVEQLNDLILKSYGYEEKIFYILKKIFLEIVHVHKLKDLDLALLISKIESYVIHKDLFIDKIDLKVSFKIFKDKYHIQYDFNNILKLNEKDINASGIINKFLIKDIVYLGPLRFYPDREHAFNEKDNNRFDSINLWALLTKRETLRNEINEWLSNEKKLKSSYKIKIENNKIRFFDKRTNTLVTNKDIGLGISQIMPILVATNFLRDKWIFIEQPELHLHPAIQAELGDEIIKGIKWGNYYLIETHSEYLLLRIMKRMKYHANNKIDREKRFDITNKDVSVLYIDSDDENIFILSLELAEDGSLLDPWPGGFFEEGFKERFE
ncbi:AAA family ATPase [Caminibacter pacificus]